MARSQDRLGVRDPKSGLFFFKPKSGRFETHPFYSPPTKTPLLTHFVTKSGPSGRSGQVLAGNSRPGKLSAGKYRQAISGMSKILGNTCTKIDAVSKLNLVSRVRCMKHQLTTTCKQFRNPQAIVEVGSGVSFFIIWLWKITCTICSL